MAPSMMSLLAASAVFSIGLVAVCPEYTINGSRIATTMSLFGLIVLCRVIYTVVLYPWFLTPFKDLPQMNLIGRFMNRRDIEAAFVDFAKSINQKHDGLLRSYMPHAREMLIVLGPEGLADVLVRKPYQFEKPDHIKFDLGYLFAKGLFTAEGVEHKALRKNLAPAFAFRHIQSLNSIFWSKSLEMVSAIEKQLGAQAANDGVVQMHDWTTRATLDIIGIAGMGFDFGSLRDPGNRVHQEYKRITSMSRRPNLFLGVARAFGLESVFRLGLKMQPTELRIRDAAMATVRGIAAQMVQNERVKEKQGGESFNIISVAMRSGNFSDEALVDETMTFIGAGHESTSAAMLWGVYSMCQYPDVQKRLREEIRGSLNSEDIFGPDESLIESIADKIHRLPYLNAFVNEVLRFHPSVPVTLRRSVCDTTVDGVFVPADTALALPIRAINRDPRLWGSGADEFNPERWLAPGMTNSGGAAINYANMTFLHGPRSCIGRDFARFELLFLMAALAGAFQMELKEPGKELDTVLQITLLPRDGLMVRLSPLGPW
ncbi:cytochrome P450 [Trichoderma pleuroticola]